MIKNLKKKLAAAARREQILVSELSDDAPERAATTAQILKRSKSTMKKLTTLSTELTSKVTSITDEEAALVATATGLTEKLSGIQSEIAQLKSSIKLLVDDRKSKKTVLKSYGAKKSSIQSGESAIVTQTAIDGLTKKIKSARKALKALVQTKNEAFAASVTARKQGELLGSRKKEIEFTII